MVLDLGRLSARVALCLVLFFSCSGLGVERVCLTAWKAAAMPDHETTSAAVSLPLLLIEDPYHQVNPHSPFPLVHSDWHVHERLKAVHRVLEVHNDRVKIILDEWNTWVVEYSKNPELFSEGELAGPARIILVLKSPLDENPELLLQGVITQLLFDRLPLMKGHFRKAFDEGSARLLAVVKEKAEGNEPLRERLAGMSDEDLDYQIHETVKLRITWILKIRFYRTYVRRYPDLRRAHLNNPRHAEVLDNLETHDSASAGDTKFDFDKVLLEEFVGFYSHSISQHLDPEIVQAVWHIPLSGLWESSMLMPDQLQPAPSAIQAAYPANLPIL